MYNYKNMQDHDIYTIYIIYKLFCMCLLINRLLIIYDSKFKSSIVFPITSISLLE